MIDKIVVHGGTFHADDVCSVSIVKLMNPNIKYERVVSVSGYNVNSADGTIVADIGFGIFDHHDKASKTRRDGGPHSACTLIWEKFGQSIIENLYGTDSETACRAARKMEEKMLFPIANSDNGIFCAAFTINDIIAQINPSWEHMTKEDADKGFSIAVGLMDKILRATLDRVMDEIHAEKYVFASIKEMQDGILILPQFLPWQDACIEDKRVLVVVFPSNRAGYCIQMVPVGKNSFQTRVDTPKEWHGLCDEDAKKAFPGMMFCHKNGFLATFETKNEAIEAAKTVVGLKS